MRAIIVVLLLALGAADLHGQWTEAQGGSGGFTSFLTTESMLYATSARGGIHASSDRGRNWREIQTGLWELSFTTTSMVEADGRLFAGSLGGGVAMSSDDGITWSVVNNGFPNQAFVTSLAVVGDTIYAGMSPMMFAGEVFRTSIDTIDWKRADLGLPVGTAYVNALVATRTGDLFLCFSTDVTPRAENVYVSFDGAGSWQPIPVEQAINVYSLVVDGEDLYAVASSGLFILTSAGTTWQELGDIPATDPVTAAIRGSQMFVGTAEQGIYRSTDNGESWTSCNEGLPIAGDSPLALWTDGNRAVSSLVLNNRIWHRTIGTSRRDDLPEAGDMGLDLTPNSTSGSTRIGYHLPLGGEVTLRLYNLLGRELMAIDDGWKSEGDHMMTLDTRTLSPGAYMVDLQAGGRRMMRRLVVQR